MTNLITAIISRLRAVFSYPEDTVDRFDACLKIVLLNEGGWSDHPADPGGATMYGITLDTYRQTHPGASKADLRAITMAEVSAIYRAGYWDRVRGDDLPAGLDLVAFDGAVNSGVYRGAKWLQSAVGVTADGQIGAKTVSAAKAANVPSAIKRALQARKNFLLSLSTWSTFGKGWTARLSRVEAEALKMAKEA
ncbi:glycoside hydrolase family 108 protein [Paenirhodobacter enshiensis]|uniref:glycoside hydrolase family 108 protein n=1 Tax=Paenirhodobacter enshiensis TaxID=1105367 RepID=UPI0035B03853